MSTVSEGLSVSAERSEARESEASLPPVGEVGVASLILIVIGGIYMSAHYPRASSLLIPSVLAGCSWILLISAMVMLARARGLARGLFYKVGKWTLLVYVVVAGMLEYVFIYDGTGGNALVVLTSMLLILAIDVPMIISFTVARFTGTN